MKTVLITGMDPVPAPLRALVERGSTSLAEHRAEAGGAEPPDLAADRVVFWTAGGEPHVRALAERYARAEAAERREILVYVTGAAGGAVAGLSSNEQYVWPADEDRLKMAFLTGA